MKIIALEEEFITAASVEAAGLDMQNHPYTMQVSSEIIGRDVKEAFMDLGAERIKLMDEAGIDCQVLSFCAPQLKDALASIAMMKEGNDISFAAMQKYPGRYCSFVSLPLADPRAAATEFERCLNKPGFVGGFLAGTICGEFLDEEKFWPVLEMAEKRQAPIYIHPYFPLPEIMNSYFKGREELSGPEWGFMLDASCHFMRLVTAGVFDRFPGLKIILGHLGESIPYNLERIDNRLRSYAKAKKLKKPTIDYFRDNLLITTSGNFSVPSLLCAVNTIGIDNILFAVDWPNESNKIAVNFLKNLPLSQFEIEKIAHLNAKRVLKL